MENKFYAKFGYSEGAVSFKVPGRLEIGGNHTDHNGGKVLSAPIDMYCFGLASPKKGRIIRVFSKGLGECVCDLDDLEKNRGFGALVSGVAAAFMNNRYKVGGFDMYVESDIPIGKGLSSSAAFSVLVGRVLSSFYNKDKLKPIEIARAAQYAEREFYKKPCGLLDQLTCAYGCPILTDFSKQKVKRVDFCLDGYDIMLVDTLSSHEGLDEEYARIPQDMMSVAALFGKEDLHAVSRKKLIKNSALIRERCGDLALLRALHFVDESLRAETEASALETGNIKKFLQLVDESGRSSAEYLQNAYLPASSERPIPLAVNIARSVLEGDGACRLHGGGFAGSVLVISPWHKTEFLKKQMKAVFGKNCIMEIKIPTCF